jgi:phosphopentomutase
MKNRFKRVFTIVVDSWGFGSAPDSYLFCDEGADTVGHIASSVKSFRMFASVAAAAQASTG